jgi:hypothetical protein
MAAFVLLGPSAGLSTIEIKGRPRRSRALLAARTSPDLFWRAAVVVLTFCDDGGVVQRTGSVVEDPHGLGAAKTLAARSSLGSYARDGGLSP